MRGKKLLKEKQQKSMQKTLDRVLCHRVRASLLQHRSCKTAKIKKLDCDDEYGVPLNVLHRTQMHSYNSVALTSYFQICMT